MQMTDIPRIKLVAHAETLGADMLDECAALLGYRRPDGNTVTGTLRRALTELDIDILDGRSVEKYMMEKLVAANLAEQQAHHADPNWNSSLESGFHFLLSHTWNGVPMEAYRGVIPDYVIRKAVQIKKRVPEAEFIIHHLAKDPFLAVRVKMSDYRYEAYYVEVWDEAFG